MSLNLLAVQDQITAKLRELAQDVYETAPPEDSKLRFDANGNLLPYIVVQYSDMYPMGFAGGIVSAKYDVARAYCLVSCVAPSERAARQVSDAVKNKLMGFKPTDAGELTFGGGSIEYASEESRASKYVADVGFEFPVNTIW